MAILSGVQTTPEALLQRIDAIMRELQEMRRLIMSQSRQIDEDLVEQLWGILGHGDWDEYQEELDWEYFG